MLSSAKQHNQIQSAGLWTSLNFPIFWGEDDLAEGKLPRRKQNFAAWWLANSLALSGVMVNQSTNKRKIQRVWPCMALSHPEKGPCCKQRHKLKRRAWRWQEFRVASSDGSRNILKLSKAMKNIRHTMGHRAFNLWQRRSTWKVQQHQQTRHKHPHKHHRNKGTQPS